jgi:hypothetical protein
LDARLLLALPVLLAACGKGDPKAPTRPVREPHAAPHGGEVLDVGDGEAHLELIHDHTGGNVTVYVLDENLKDPIPVATPTILIATEDGPKEFALTAVDPAPDGTSAVWRGSHPGLVSDPWDGRIRITIRGKAHQIPLEGPPHTHD